MSPIHDQSYRRYTGTRLPVGGSWAVIARHGISVMVAKRAFLALMIFAWIPFIVRCVQLYIVANYPQAGAIAGAQREGKPLEQRPLTECFADALAVDQDWSGHLRRTP